MQFEVGLDMPEVKRHEKDVFIFIGYELLIKTS